MTSFVLRRLMSAVPTIFIVVTISFFLMRFAPGGPFNLERPLPPQTMANIMATYKLDQPLISQYLSYIGNAVTGDLGPSFIYKDNTVAELIGKDITAAYKLTDKSERSNALNEARGKAKEAFASRFIADVESQDHVACPGIGFQYKAILVCPRAHEFLP